MSGATPPAVSLEKLTAAELALRAFIRKYEPGSCRVFSNPECSCPRCRLDIILAAARRVVVLEAASPDAPRTPEPALFTKAELDQIEARHAPGDVYDLSSHVTVRLPRGTFNRLIATARRAVAATAAEGA